ncbi:MAG: ATP-dependent DNA helicase RecG [Ruminococcus sp.]|nr:ATP-dependent DNA helicase RecG [Ruminococcus sp.]MDY3895578.1 ATP-dependent DNA helicase RecG [Candidatus Fimenecus sp.]
MDFSTEIKYLKGVGPARAEAFSKLGVDTVGALLRFYPRAYEDWSNIMPIREAPVGTECCIRGVVSYAPTKVRIPGGKLLSKTSITDGKGILNLVFFNNKYIGNMLKEGEEYLFFGKITVDKHGIKEMVSPLFSKEEGDGRIRPIYPQTAGLSSKLTEKCTMQILKNCKEIPEFMPPEILAENDLCSLDFAIRNIHFPENFESLDKAKKRLIFDELFILQLGLLSIKNRTDEEKTDMVLKKDCTEEFYARLPFSPTGAQKRAVFEAFSDMSSGEPMNRLLQGDVGSGKTLVAAALIYNTAKNGMQSAFMAPTEVLAEQHFRTLSKIFDGTDINTVLLTGSSTEKEKREIKKAIRDGSADLVIGTHAIIQDDVEFLRLGLAVTDEQHRFGVAQRAALSKKGQNPNILVMSATPIPRTLGLIIYGDLSVSVLDELPPGRQKTETYCVSQALHERIYNFIKKHLDKGYQAYIVCPLVEEGDSDLIPAQEYCKFLQNTAFRGYRLGLLHGQMKSKEKDNIMRDFESGKIQLLVSTVVIEVGVDVPNAVIMVIENAERFGLSQLHQLRGRVGRGNALSTCILVSDAQNDEAKRRFDIMCKTTDGFLIADEDLKMRGPGDFFGSKQHGLPSLRIADILTDTKILKEAQKSAQKIIATDGKLQLPEHKNIKRQIDKMFGNGYVKA